MRYFTLIFSILLVFSCSSAPKTSHGAPLDVKRKSSTVKKSALKNGQIEFPSKDDLPITADLYHKEGNKDFILLCHQAGFSRGEYINTAPKLLEMGFDCLAIDQRAGRKANDIYNETFKAAVARQMNVRYTDAVQDIEAAINKAYELNNNQPIILVGSSYSAALALYLGNTDKVKAIAAFSPGEYIRGFEIGQAAKALKKPVFVTCAKKEITAVEQLLIPMAKENLIFYKPSEKGIHGSRALWDSTEGHEGYWTAFREWVVDVKG